MAVPKVSIIVPVYNVENFVAKCIQSIIDQTFINFELLIIDDGSIDNSLNICKEFAKKDSRIRIFENENNGVSVARNIGIKNAVSKWICFIDSDDYVEKDYLENFFKTELNDNSIVFQGIILNYDNSQKLEYFSSYSDAQFVISDTRSIVQSKILFDGCPYAKLYNRNVIINNNLFFNTELSLHEDHDFVWNYLLFVKDIILVNKHSYNYMRRNVTSLSTKRHPSEEFILSSGLLSDKLNRLSQIIGLTKGKEYNEIWSKFGLHQIIEALKSVENSNYKSILRYARRHKNDLIYKYKTTFVKKLGIILILASPDKISKNILTYLYK